MSRPLFNLALRQQLVQRVTQRSATTTAQAAQAAQNAAANATATASNAASNAANVASNAAQNAFASAQKAAPGVVTKVTGYVEPFIYYTRVTLEFARQVAVNSKLGIPDFGAATGGISNFYNAFKTGAWRKVTLRQAGEVAGEGVKITGFFIVGEMIGRGSIIGYHIPGTFNTGEEDGGH
ncbi:hypothetical protein HDV00_005321 [Rhizophlyctis rosea]|nr:hypothetical protein HDV00_005321 [Rhizophlyctis rosea]